MMNAATFNAYLDMVGISHKTAAKECSVDRQTIKRRCLGEYDIPSAIEKWILGKVKMHDACVEEICKDARIESTAEGVAFIPYERYREPRKAGETALSAALKERSWRMAAISDAICRLRTEGYEVVCDYNAPEKDNRINTVRYDVETSEGESMDKKRTYPVRGGDHFRVNGMSTQVDNSPYSSHGISLGDSAEGYNRYDKYVTGIDGSYIGNEPLIKAVIDGEIEKPMWMPKQDIETYKNIIANSKRGEYGDR